MQNRHILTHSSVKAVSLTILSFALQSPYAKEAVFRLCEQNSPYLSRQGLP